MLFNLALNVYEQLFIHVFIRNVCYKCNNYLCCIKIELVYSYIQGDSFIVLI